MGKKNPVVICNYCNQKTKLVKGNAIYPHRKDLYNTYFYLCKPCNAYVGCHKGTIQPLGRVANEPLRKAKSKAHAAFDPIWRSKEMKRRDAYYWLSKQLDISVQDCHIGMFDIDNCNKVIEVCRQYRINKIIIE